MLYLLLSLIFASALSSVSSISISPAGHTISYEAHGMDDLREWRAGFTKGWEYVKIDINFQDPDYCNRQDRVPKPVDTRGCFVIIHTATPAGTDLNTSQDILSWLNDTNNHDLLSSTLPRRYFQLNFKSRPSLCDGSQSAANWISLFNDFFNGANKVIDTWQLNVEFYLDTIGESCVYQQWRPWVSSWDSGTINSQALDNNATNGDDRFQVVNLAANNNAEFWQNLSDHQFYKFINSSYSFVCYEPSNEYQINQFSDIYLSSGIVHEPGFRIASNTDPIMYQLYASSRSGHAWHERINRTTDAIRPQSTILGINGSNIHVTVYYEARVFFYILHFLDNITSPFFFRSTTPSNLPAPLPNTWGNITSLSSLTSLVSNGLLIGDENGNIGVYTLSSDGTALTYSIDSFQRLAPPSTLVSSSVVDVVADQDQGLVYLFQVFRSQNATTDPCLFYLQLYSLKNYLTKAQPINSSHCLTNHPQSGSFAGLSVAATSSPPKTQNTSLCAPGSAELVITYAFDLKGIDKRTYLIHLCLSMSSGAILSQVPSVSASLTPPLFAVGSFPSVSILRDRKDPSRNNVLVLNQDAFCWNSKPRDDIPLGYPKCCDTWSDGFGESEPGLLSYTVGDSRILVSRVNNTQAGLLVVSACDASLLHGTFDQGDTVSSSLLVSPSTTVAFSVHVAREGENKCGEPLPHTGLVFDAWTVVEV